MSKHNPKLNLCLPITPYPAAIGAGLAYRRNAAARLIPHGAKPRHIRKALILSGRQFRKAQREAKASLA